MYTKGKWEAIVWENYTTVETPCQTICTYVSNCDASLIAAAPDMYEALEAIVAEGLRCVHGEQLKPVREIYNINEVDRLARQALAKADIELK